LNIHNAFFGKLKIFLSGISLHFPLKSSFLKGEIQPSSKLSVMLQQGPEKDPSSSFFENRIIPKFNFQIA